MSQDSAKPITNITQARSAYLSHRWDEWCEIVDKLRKDEAPQQEWLQVQIGIAHLFGWGRNKDAALAADLFQQSADAGEPEASYYLGLCHFAGLGTRIDDARAMQAFEFAAASGHALGKCMFGHLTRRAPWPERNWIRAAELIAESFPDIHCEAKLGCPHAAGRIGMCYANGFGTDKDFTEAAKWYQVAAEHGEMIAQRNLGLCYASGDGVEQDAAKALNCYRAAADAGYADAFYSVGAAILNGKGVEADPVEAVKWFRQGADRGDTTAQYQMGLCYKNGSGVEQDSQEAARWYREAAQGYNVAAQHALAECYHQGTGVDVDLDEAKKWYRMAGDRGNRNSLDALYLLDAPPKTIKLLTEKIVDDKLVSMFESGDIPESPGDIFTRFIETAETNLTRLDENGTLDRALQQSYSNLSLDQLEPLAAHFKAQFTMKLMLRNKLESFSPTAATLWRASPELLKPSPSDDPTTLYYSLYCDDLATARVLLALGAEPKACSDGLNDPVYGTSDEEMLKELFLHGADGDAVLVRAAEHGHSTLVRVLLATRPDTTPDSLDQCALIAPGSAILAILSEFGVPSRTILGRAIDLGDIEFIQRHLETATDITDDDFVALADTTDDPQVLRALLTHGADREAILRRASEVGDDTFAIELLDSVEPDTKIELETAAGVAKDLTSLQLLWERGAAGNVVLVKAAELGGHGIVDEILKKDGEIEQTDLSHALDEAARNGRWAITQMLIHHGAAVDGASAEGCNTPLHHAARGGISKVATALLNGGADPNRRAKTMRRRSIWPPMRVNLILPSSCWMPVPTRSLATRSRSHHSISLLVAVLRSSLNCCLNEALLLTHNQPTAPRHWRWPVPMISPFYF